MMMIIMPSCTTLFRTLAVFSFLLSGLFCGVLVCIFSHTTSTFQLLDKPWSRCRPFSSLVLAFNFIAHRVQQSHCWSIFHRVSLNHALALSACQFVHKRKSLRIYMSMHSGGLELTTLTYTRLEDSLIHHQGDRRRHTYPVYASISLDLPDKMRLFFLLCLSL